MEREKAELSQKMSVLSAKARATAFMPEKERLQAERGKLYSKTTELQDRIEKLREKSAESKVIVLVRESRHDIIVKVNGTRIRIPENLEIAIPFSCGHTVKLQAHELFRYQTQITTNQQLLSFWQQTLKLHESYTRILTCEQCKREREAYIKKHHVIPNKQSGTTRLTVEVI